jgi:hypothetical protein
VFFKLLTLRRQSSEALVLIRSKAGSYIQRQ